MQFIKDGPDIPERLLQAHEDGRVVFFCGAGTSYPAGLPGFSGLVKSLYAGLGEEPNGVEKAAIAAQQFDTAVGQLEGRIVGGRQTVRRQLAKTLTPDMKAQNATATQEALLTLAKQREGRYRLITTNFDRLFEEVIEAKMLSVATYEAPLLPVPKNRWDGLVYLHGLLAEDITAGNLDRMVISSGDFGLAYLTERWAARFVSELFRNFTICFVGYSINDPVLRYMMDALAADRLLGESSPEMFAFGGTKKGQEEIRANEWRAKNVTPILYSEIENHSMLHKTLRSWADVYRDGVLGKERIVMQYASTIPMASTVQDNFVGRMLWALCDKHALPAKRFADHDPLPLLDWLEPLMEFRFAHGDLPRFGVSPDVNEDKALKFSIIRRPSPYAHSALMALVNNGSPANQWDKVMHETARWLVRHVHDPALILWIVKQGGHVHNQFGWMISKALVANPVSPMMSTLWRIVLSKRIRAGYTEYDLYDWGERFHRYGMTTTMRLELRDILAPRVELREPFRMWDEDDAEDPATPSRIKDIVNWEITLGGDHVHSALSNIIKTNSWLEALPDVLPDATALLRDAMDLMRELGGADAQNDYSYIHQPSISSHAQNRAFHEWTFLIELVRDAWLETAARYPERARLAVMGWETIQYPIFRRLALFAGAHAEAISADQSLDLLLADQSWWLWSVETQREAIRLLVSIAPKLDAIGMLELEESILRGPPRSMFRDDLEHQDLQDTFNQMIWLRLAKAQEANARLSAQSMERLQAIAAQFPDLKLAVDEQDEFSSWMGNGNELITFVVAPKTRTELVEWLQTDIDRWQEHDWRDRCRDHFGAASTALMQLSKEGKWPVARWREALQAWSDEALSNRSWRFLAKTVNDAPDDVLEDLASSLTWWLRSLAKNFAGHENVFWRLVTRILAIQKTVQFEPDNDPVFRAINHPIGQVAEALFQRWYRDALQDGQGLKGEIKPLLTELCDTEISIFTHARVIIASNLIALFRVDPDWTLSCLIPLFEWDKSLQDTRAVWEGFLWSPRLYRPLQEVLKRAILTTAEHYDQLGKHSGQYAAYLMFTALEPDTPFSKLELTKATRSLPADGLAEAARALVRALEGAGDQQSEYWQNRVQPYIKAAWPKSRTSVTTAISESFSRLTLATGDSFAHALGVLKYWLQPIEYPDFIVQLLHEADFCNRFPQAALEFLSLIVGATTKAPATHLANCLAAIRAAEPSLNDDIRLARLMDYLRR